MSDLPTPEPPPSEQTIPRAHLPMPSPPTDAASLGPSSPLPAPPSPPATALTPEQQRALFAKDLQENDWGHQPC